MKTRISDRARQVLCDAVEGKVAKMAIREDMIAGTTVFADVPAVRAFAAQYQALNNQSADKAESLLSSVVFGSATDRINVNSITNAILHEQDGGFTMNESLSTFVDDLTQVHSRADIVQPR